MSTRNSIQYSQKYILSAQVLDQNLSLGHTILLVPFIKVEEPYDEIKEVIEGVWDWWMEEGKNRERLGELMKRQGFQRLLEAAGIQPDARHVIEPRSNPYIFWKEDEVPGGWERDINEFRKYHKR